MLLLDIRDNHKFQDKRIFKSKLFDVNKNIDTQEAIAELKLKIHFKHVFIIGDDEDFENASFKKLLNVILEQEMKPFSLYFHRFKIDLLEVEYPHLLLKGEEKKKLTLYPLVVLKCKDIG